MGECYMLYHHRVPSGTWMAEVRGWLGCGVHGRVLGVLCCPKSSSAGTLKVTAKQFNGNASEMPEMLTVI